MQIDKKKIAAIAAVAHYIKTREEAPAWLPSNSLEVSDSATDSASTPAPVNIWGLGGRQSQMQLRTMMQLKAFHGPKRG
jgi:hypothetical protein